MKGHDEAREQNESTEGLQALEAAFGDEGLLRSKRAVGDLLHSVDDERGPRIAFLWQIRLLGLSHLTTVTKDDDHVRVKSKQEFARQFEVSFDLILDHDEIPNDLRLYDWPLTSA